MNDEIIVCQCQHRALVHDEKGGCLFCDCKSTTLEVILQAQLAQAQERIAQLDEYAEHGDRDRDMVIGKYNDLVKEHQETSSKLAQAQGEIERLRGEIEFAHSVNDSLRVENDAMRKQLAAHVQNAAGNCQDLSAEIEAWDKASDEALKKMERSS